MKYLKKFNENKKFREFPNPEIPINLIDDFVSQHNGVYDIDLEKIPGFGEHWDIEIANTDIARYYARVFPNEIGYLPDHIRERFIPRIDYHITCCIKKVEELRKLYNDLKFIPKALFQEGYYSYMSFNDGQPMHCTKGRYSCLY